MESSKFQGFVGSMHVVYGWEVRIHLQRARAPDEVEVCACATVSASAADRILGWKPRTFKYWLQLRGDGRSFPFRAFFDRMVEEGLDNVSVLLVEKADLPRATGESAVAVLASALRDLAFIGDGALKTVVFLLPDIISEEIFEAVLSAAPGLITEARKAADLPDHPPAKTQKE